MGSDCTAHFSADSFVEFETLALAAEGEVVRIERRYSRYRADSELSRINAVAARGGSVDVDAETAALMEYAKACYTKSGGVFDITSGVLRAVWDFSRACLPGQDAVEALLPRIGLDKVAVSDGRLHFAEAGMELDFGGLAKEYAADRAAEVCASAGARHGFVDLAGDIRIVGPRPDGAPWMIGIRHPRDAQIVVSKVAMSMGGLATSGDYERFIEIDGRRYCHLLDPRTGWPVRGLSSVTVISDRCLVAGSLSTIAMLKGRQGVEWLHQLGIRHFAVTADGECHGTEECLKRCS
ncbi:MAG TPA: FAD:protein FMN transferase [Steroidobacteraceae bacterium]|nr:FAD:protein FMN transferase [Steroidobacteraceae bacterium]